MPPLPKPAHLQIVDKSHSDRHFEQPVPSSDPPIAPDRLSPAAKGIFERMVLRISDLYPPSKSHTEMLALYAECEEFIQHCEKILRVEGITYETEKGSINARPEVGMIKQYRLLAKSILCEFGLSPSSQRNVKVQQKKEKTNPFGEFSK